MKVINARGRTLLEVTAAQFYQGRVTYSYRGDGFGGTTYAEGIQAQVNIIKGYSKSAKVVGTLPEPPVAGVQ